MTDELKPLGRWPVQERHRQAVVQRLVMIVADAESEKKEVIAAARALIAAEGQNQSDEQHSKGETIHHTGTITLQAAAIRQEMLKDPDYLDLLRKRAMPTNGVHHAED